MRRVLLVLLVGVLAASAAVLVRHAPAAPGPPPSAATTEVAPAHSRALRVLHHWDRRRARAWEEGSVRRLGALYLPGSAAGRADRAMLVAYRERGLRVVGMRRQTLGIEVVAASGGVLTLEVTDRLVRAVAVGRGIRRALPQGAVATRRLTFRRSGTGWVLVG